MPTRRKKTPTKDERSHRSEQPAEPSHHAEHSQPGEASQQYEDPEQDERSQPDEPAYRSDRSQDPRSGDHDELQAMMRRVAREVCQEMLQGMSAVNIVSGQGMPPEPTREQGRTLSRKYERITVTVDTKLLKLLDKHARKTRLSRGRIIDGALWHFFGKPNLSYRDERSEDTADD